MGGGRFFPRAGLAGTVEEGAPLWTKEKARFMGGPFRAVP